MPRVICLNTKEEKKILWELQRSWSPELRKSQAAMLRGLRNGTFRPWEQLTK